MSAARLLMSNMVVAMALACTPSQAIAPAIIFFAKQMLTDMVSSGAKNMLLDSLSGLGCKGQALANAITSAGNATSLRGMLGGAGGMPAMPGMGSMAMPPEMAARMQGMMPPGTALGAGMALTPEMAAMIAQLQGGGLGESLSPLETMATIDEMSELGLLSKAMNTELKECLLLLPAAAPTMGMAMGMMKPILPKIRAARDQMRALSLEDQDELAASLAQELDNVPAKDRKAMLAELGGGLFPPRVVDTLNKRYGAK